MNIKQKVLQYLDKFDSGPYVFLNKNGDIVINLPPEYVILEVGKILDLFDAECTALFPERDYGKYKPDPYFYMEPNLDDLAKDIFEYYQALSNLTSSPNYNENYLVKTLNTIGSSFECDCFNYHFLLAKAPPVEDYINRLVTIYAQALVLLCNTYYTLHEHNI